MDRPLYPGESAHFAGAETAGASPLAAEILALAGVESVLIADNTVTVCADAPGRLAGARDREHHPQARPRRGFRPSATEYLRDLPSEGDLKWAIRDLLDREINPAVAQHGGYVELIDVRRNNVYLRLGGGCQGCGAADVTLKQGIEKAIRDLAPRVGEILDTTDHAAGRNPFYAPAK